MPWYLNVLALLAVGCYLYGMWAYVSRWRRTGWPSPRYWLSSLHSWRYELTVKGLARRYRSNQKAQSLGNLRFTRSRRVQFGDGPPEARDRTMPSLRVPQAHASARHLPALLEPLYFTAVQEAGTKTSTGHPTFTATKKGNTMSLKDLWQRWGGIKKPLHVHEWHYFQIYWKRRDAWHSRVSFLRECLTCGLETPACPGEHFNCRRGRISKDQIEHSILNPRVVGPDGECLTEMDGPAYQEAMERMKSATRAGGEHARRK